MPSHRPSPFIRKEESELGSSISAFDIVVSRNEK